MTMLTVDDLARDLKVKNEDLLKELLTMGYQVEGPESPLVTDDPEALRAQLVTVLPQREVVEKRIKPTVIRRRMKKPSGRHEHEQLDVLPQQPRLTTPSAGAEHQGHEERPDLRRDVGKIPIKKGRRPEPARIIEMAPKPSVPPRVETSARAHTSPPDPQRDRFEPEGPEVGGVPESWETQPAPRAETARETESRLGAEPGLRGDEGGEGIATPGHPSASETRPSPELRAAPSGKQLRLGEPVAAEEGPQGPAAREEDHEEPDAGDQSEEQRLAGDRGLKKKKKKEKKVQPAQIIGRVELRREPPREVIEQREGHQPTDRPPFRDRPDQGNRPDSGERPPFRDRPDTRPGPDTRDRPGERPPYGQQRPGERPPYGQQRPGERPPYGQQRPGERPPYGQQRPGERPPYGQQRPGERPPYGQQRPGERPPYGQQRPGERPPYGQQRPGERPPYGQRPGERPPFGGRPRVGEPLGARAHVPVITETEEEIRRKKRQERKGREVHAEAPVDDSLKVRRRKEVLLRDELYDDRQRGGRLRGKAKKVKRKTEITTPKAIKRRIKLPEMVTVVNIAHRLSVKAPVVIRQLLSMGVTATVNDAIDYDTATLLAAEFGFEIEPLEQSEASLLASGAVGDTQYNLVSRSPVVTVMGHVDHGKTSLLDAIRSTHVTDQEAGGITQHIGAYKVKVDRGEVVFLDTPGHEAFTAMRARGAHVTDFVILVVAADDGVMEQTREAINHSRAAGVPIIVAVNKMDKPEADKDRVIRELSEHGLIPESWGGDTLYAFVSAKTNQGIDELLDLILLQAEMMELKANPDKPATGAVVEARLDKGKGPVATVLIREGTLRLGDAFVAGMHYGKVRAMLDHEGRNVEIALPATPVEVHGFAGVPEAGDSFLVAEEERIARQISTQRQDKVREKETATAIPSMTLEDLLARMQEQESKELNIILKGDVQGSVEALKDALVGCSAQEIKVKVIHSGVGTITESDVMLASASSAIVVGFNVRPGPKTVQIAEQEKVDIRLYSVIYETIDDIRKAMEGMLAPIEKENIVGRAEVLQTFSVPKIGLIAGCQVKSGKIERSNQVRLIRDGRLVHQGKIMSMKRFKEDVKEAVEGYECGIALEGFRDLKVGDVIEAFVIEKESAKLT